MICVILVNTWKAFDLLLIVVQSIAGQKGVCKTGCTQIGGTAAKRRGINKLCTDTASVSWTSQSMGCLYYSSAS